jgi:hypothetical protein
VGDDDPGDENNRNWITEHWCVMDGFPQRRVWSLSVPRPVGSDVVLTVTHSPLAMWIRIGYAQIQIRMSLFTTSYFEFGYEYEYKTDISNSDSHSNTYSIYSIES